MIKIILRLLGRGIKTAYSLDSGAKQDLNQLGENYVVKLDIKNASPVLCFWIERGKVKTKHGAYASAVKADLTISFKSVQQAKSVLFGSRSISKAYAQHDFLVAGDIFKAMAIVRVLKVVEAYLFPKFMTKKLFNEFFPTTTRNKCRFYFKCLLGV